MVANQKIESLPNGFRKIKNETKKNRGSSRAVYSKENKVRLGGGSPKVSNKTSWEAIGEIYWWSVLQIASIVACRVLLLRCYVVSPSAPLLLRKVLVCEQCRALRHALRADLVGFIIAPVQFPYQIFLYQRIACII